jgi:hypothetical protein
MAEHVSKGSAGRAILFAATTIAAIIVLHIVFVLVDANSANAIVSTDSDWASTLGGWFKDLFTPSSHKLAVTLNYGLAAIFYLVIGRVVAALVNSV